MPAYFFQRALDMTSSQFDEEMTSMRTLYKTAQGSQISSPSVPTQIQRMDEKARTQTRRPCCWNPLHYSLSTGL